MSKRIAIIGAGPIGIEGALYGRALGHDVCVYERGRVGENVSSWGHVRLFSAFGINHSTLGARALAKSGGALSPTRRGWGPDAAGEVLPGKDAYVTGAEYVETYLKPLAGSAPLEGRVRENVTVVSIGRDGIGKRSLIGGKRDAYPFRLLLDGPRGEEVAEADVVIDASGTYGHHNWMGSGGLPALGERSLRDRIRYTLDDVGGAARDRYAGRSVLLVGVGHSAATALEALTTLPGTSVVWISNKDREAPLDVIPDDPLPARARLSLAANTLAAGENASVDFRKSTLVDRVEERGGGFRVWLRTGGRSETVDVEAILALVGYSPDNQIYRELQVHECYASLGPMNLSAALLSEGAADCLAQKPMGADVLKNPEPDFYIVGAKSYGKSQNFLIRIGLSQVRETYTLIEGRSDLDLYAA